MSIMQLVKKKKGKKRPGYRGEAAAASDAAAGRDAGRSDTGSASGRGDGQASRGDGGDRREQRSVATTQGISPTTQSDLGIDRGAVGQFSQYGRNLMNQNLRPTLAQRLGGFGSTVLGGILGLINTALGLVSRGITSIQGVFNKFRSSGTLEEFRDQLRGYGRTMPVVSNNPAFGGIETLGLDDEEDLINAGIINTNQFNQSPFGDAEVIDMQENQGLGPMP